MGKPKALRNRDVVPAVTVSKEVRKHMTFDDDDEATKNLDIPTVPTAVAPSKDYVDDNEPEEMRTDNKEILELKKLHESMIEPSKRQNKLKRKALAESSSKLVSTADDQELAESVLSFLNEKNENDDAVSVIEDDTETRVGQRINKTQLRGKKIGNLYVSVLEEESLDPLSNYKLTKAVEAFQAKCFADAGERFNLACIILFGFDSDIDDGGEVEANIHENELQNGLSVGSHIAHTWGAEWRYVEHIKFIVASDILLYVSAYASLVQSLVRMFEANGVLEFVMAWNRRISESGTFFDMMREAGFLCHHHGKCVYSFYRPGHTDSYLDGLAVNADNASPNGLHTH